MSREIVIKYEFSLQSRKILSNAALSVAKQSLIYDSCPGVLVSPSFSSRLFSKDG